MYNKLKSYKLPACKSYDLSIAGRQANRGFTLIETMIYMGLLAVILLVVTNLMITTGYFSQEETIRLAIQQNGRYAIDKIINDLENTNSVDIPTDTNPSNNLSFGDISYQVTTGILERTESGETDSVTSNQVKVNSISFERIENPGGQPTIKINLNVGYIGRVEGDKDISQDFETTYYVK